MGKNSFSPLPNLSSPNFPLRFIPLSKLSYLQILGRRPNLGLWQSVLGVIRGVEAENGLRPVCKKRTDDRSELEFSSFIQPGVSTLLDGRFRSPCVPHLFVHLHPVINIPPPSLLW